MNAGEVCLTEIEMEIMRIFVRNRIFDNKTILGILYQLQNKVEISNT